MGGVIATPDVLRMMQCDRCQKSLFTVLVDGSGALLICAGCNRKFKLESIGGVKLLNA